MPEDFIRDRTTTATQIRPASTMNEENAMILTAPETQADESGIASPALLVRDVVKIFGKDEQPSQLSRTLASLRRSDPPKPKKQTIAVNHVSFDVRRGEIFGILGANGSGKSTLIRLLSTLLLPDGGEVSVFGHNVVQEEDTVKRMINRVSVEAAFFKKLSPMENLIYAARLYDLPAAYARERIVKILASLGLRGERVYNPMENLSRGTQQKVAIARALLTSPVLMLLDEPTTGLDPRSKHDVQKYVLKVRKDHDTTVILTTHDMDEAERLCDRIAILDDGKIIAQDTPQGLKDSLTRQNGFSGGKAPSMEDVFMTLVGKSADDLAAEDDE